MVSTLMTMESVKGVSKRTQIKEKVRSRERGRLRSSFEVDSTTTSARSGKLPHFITQRHTLSAAYKTTTRAGGLLLSIKFTYQLCPTPTSECVIRIASSYSRCTLAF
jgi:hypothetical protein